MRLTLRQLDVMVSIARTGSTTEAGRQLALSQSAVSAALAELESQLGTRVFDRVGKRVVLNDCGRLLLPRALAVLDQMREIEHLIDDGAGSLRVGASTTVGNYMMPSVLGAFQRRWPMTRIELEVGNTREVVDAVAAYRVDIGFIEGPCHHPELTVHAWMDDELCVVAAPSHPAALAGAPPAALAAARWILREPGSGTRDIVESILLPHLGVFASTMHLGNSEAIKRAVAEGMGVSCLSLRVVQDWLDNGRLQRVDAGLPRLRRTLFRIHPRRKVLSVPLQRFVEHCGTWH